MLTITAVPCSRDNLIAGTYGDNSSMKGSSETESDGNGAVKYRPYADQSSVQVSAEPLYAI